MLRREFIRGGLMRAILAAVIVTVGFALAGPAGAATPPNNATIIGTPAPQAGSIVVAQRCRCVERRWNGSCKLRVCRNHW
jgi:hypothetical protein